MSIGLTRTLHAVSHCPEVLLRHRLMENQTISLLQLSSLLDIYDSHFLLLKILGHVVLLIGKVAEIAIHYRYQLTRTLLWPLSNNF